MTVEVIHQINRNNNKKIKSYTIINIILQKKKLKKLKTKKKV
jgi:hypothetical protein